MARKWLPYQTFWGSSIPPNSRAINNTRVLGVWFSVAVPGVLVGMKYYPGAGDVPARNALVAFDLLGNVVAVARPRLTAAIVGGGPWQTAYFHPLYRMVAGGKVQICLATRAGLLFQTTGGLAGGAVTNGNITALAPAASPNAVNGALGVVLAPPTSADGSNLHGVDLVFLAD